MWEYIIGEIVGEILLWPFRVLWRVLKRALDPAGNAFGSTHPASSSAVGDRDLDEPANAA